MNTGADTPQVSLYWQLGGDNDDDNLILSCATCNIRKNKKTAMEVLRRILVKMEAVNG